MSLPPSPRPATNPPRRPRCGATLFQVGNQQALANWDDYCLDLTGTAVYFDQNLALTGGVPQVVDTAAKMKINMSELLALNIYSAYNMNKNRHGVAQPTEKLAMNNAAILWDAIERGKAAKHVIVPYSLTCKASVQQHI